MRVVLVALLVIFVRRGVSALTICIIPIEVLARIGHGIPLTVPMNA